jgi:fatty-acyl-CoA synthase
MPAPLHSSPVKAWARALELTAPIASNPERTLPAMIAELADRHGDAPALLSDGESLTYGALARRSNQYARWALQQGLAKGDVVCLLMPNRPEYLAVWLGITSVGGVVALLNTNLAGASLAHCTGLVAPRHVIVSAEFVDTVVAAGLGGAESATVWIHGAEHGELLRIDRVVDRLSKHPLSPVERRAPTIEDRALLIYTSGTTGFPKAANISHARLMQWSLWFAGMTGASPGDRMYNCLPMYHSVGGVLAIGSVLAAGGSVVIRDKFSAREFWSDIVRWDCTLFQYIGELCRYLLHAEPTPHEAQHRIRMCCGNGLSGEVWDGFKTRFGIPQIFEFYAATEGNVSLFNIEGKPGAIGRVPVFLAHRSPVAIVRFDVEHEAPVRDEHGFCVRCRPNEIGEAIGQLFEDRSNVGSRFDGYSDREASEKKVLRNVFAPGDAWFRSGDLMRRDEKGYFFFVDRIGDTFRWKGENVATSEVSAALCAFPGVQQASVYGVAVPGTDGRAGMAAVVAGEDVDLAGLWTHLADRLPDYARPVFLRIRGELEMTATFKQAKGEFVRQRYNPLDTADTIYFNARDRRAFVRLDKALYEGIEAGRIRL